MNQNLRFKELRKKAKITQAKLAELMQLQTPNYISQIETGKKKIGLSVINKFCKAININIKEFFESEQKPVIKIKDPLIVELENLPAHDKDLIIKMVKSVKEISTEGKRELLKHTEEKELYEKIRKRKRKTA